MEKNIVFEKTKVFSVRIVKLYKYLTEKHRETVLSKQILRSGTSIGANIAEAECSISRKDFLAKMHIAFKECAETKYWIELLYNTEYLTKEEYVSLFADCNEIYNLLSSITKSVKGNE